MLTQLQSEFLGFLPGLAATTVLLAHGAQVFLYRRIGYEHSLGLQAGNAATLAVIFFVLSGFFVTLSLIRIFSRNGRLHPGLVFGRPRAQCFEALKRRSFEVSRDNTAKPR